MKNVKRFLGLFLAVAMLLSMVGTSAFAEGAKRNIVIGLWWDMYYDSFDESVMSNPSATEGKLNDQLMFDVVKEIEEKYNVTIEYQNLTYSGVQESINTSILAGQPDCDIYMVDLVWGVSTVLNGYATDLRTVLPEDNKLFTHEDTVMNFIDLGDGKATLLNPVAAENVVANTYPLAFNLQMIQDANLEDPRDLVAKGEWTWDKFREYCRVLTKDNDGDGATDVYGFGGWPQDYFPLLLMSNGTYVAKGEKENFSSAEVGEVLKFMQDMCLTDKSVYPIPEENGWDVCRFLYRDGKVAFTPIACWIQAQNNDYDWLGDTGTQLPFDMVYVPWPVGPSGNAETNAQKVTSGSYYILPSGVEDPELVYNVFYDLHNWYHDDVSIRDSEDAMSWWYTNIAKDIDLQDHNFSVMYEAGLRETVDNVNNLGFDYDFPAFLKGDYTPAQFQETYKQQVQDAMDRLNGK